jgi:hypothetical protein
VKVTEPILDDELKAHHCLRSIDKVPGDPETTDFKRRARFHQSLWREAAGLEIGTQPIRTKLRDKEHLLGSRLAPKQAFASEANFLNGNIKNAVRCRLDHHHRERYQTLNRDRLYCDLLSSMPMCFNFFGSFHGDIEAAGVAVRRWWPEIPGRVTEVRFEYSPGRRLKGEYLENRSAFDAAFMLRFADGKEGIIGIETKYHEHCRSEKRPTDERRKRYELIANDSKQFNPEVATKILGTDLQQIWLGHLLALSMKLHPSRRWKQAWFVLVHPERNPSYARAATRYEALLKSRETFKVVTIESLLDAGVIPGDVATAFRQRYLW